MSCNSSGSLFEFIVLSKSFHKHNRSTGRRNLEVINISKRPSQPPCIYAVVIL